MKITTVRIKSVNVLSFALMQAAILFIAALVIIMPFTLILNSLISFTRSGVETMLKPQSPFFESQASNQENQLNMLTILFIPFIYAILGFISGLIFGVIYNLSAKIFRGIKVDLEQVETEVDRPLGTEPTQ
ncbi:MAG: DUF3566 domain-containing protein [Candidatus Woesearchaeota archaeon]